MYICMYVCMQVHAYIIHYLKKQMPFVVGKSEKQKKLLDRLDKEFVACARRYNLALGAHFACLSHSVEQQKTNRAVYAFE